MRVTQQQEWIVVLECARRDGGMRQDELSRVMASLTHLNPSGLVGPDRYALQMHVFAQSAQHAVQRATTLWERALSELGLPLADLVRVEVLTPREFDWECDHGLATVGCAADETSGKPIGGTVHDDVLSNALRDPVTGLVAWDLLRHHLEYVVCSSHDRHTHALLLVEVDPDGRGLSTEHLLAVARGVRRLLRSSDMVAQTEGSRFAVFMEGTTEHVVTGVAERLAAAVATGDGGCAEAIAGIAVSKAGDDGRRLLARAAASLADARRGGSLQRFDRPPGR